MASERGKKKNFKSPKQEKQNKNLYNFIKRLHFYISYKNNNTSFINPSYWEESKKKIAYSFFKLCDLLLVCINNGIILYGEKQDFIRTSFLLRVVYMHINIMSVISSLWVLQTCRSSNTATYLAITPKKKTLASQKMMPLYELELNETFWPNCVAFSEILPISSLLKTKEGSQGVLCRANT